MRIILSTFNSISGEIRSIEVTDPISDDLALENALKYLNVQLGGVDWKNKFQITNPKGDIITTQHGMYELIVVNVIIVKKKKSLIEE